MAIYENPSCDTGEGGNFTPINRNRNSINTSGVLSIEAPAVANRITTFNEAQAATANITKTTPIFQIALGTAGVGAFGGNGGASGGRVEFVLQRNQQYAFMVESLDANDNYHTVQLDWYEHISRH
jgi:hypothetical protein